MKNLKSLKYSVFSSFDKGVEIPLSLSKTFEQWLSFWNQHFVEVNSPCRYYSDDFSRVSYVTCLESEGQVVGTHCYSYWDLRQSFDLNSRYWMPLADSAIPILQKRGLNKLLCMEYFWVHPEWRKRNTGVSLGDVMIGLGTRVALSLPVSGIFSIARKCVKADQMCFRWGFSEMGETKLHNNDCTFIFCNKESIKWTDDLNVARWVKYFWENRNQVDLSEYQSKKMVFAS